MIRPSSLRLFGSLMLAAFVLNGLSGCASKELAREVEALQSWHQGYRDAFEAVLDDYAQSYLSAVKVRVDAVVGRTKAERLRSLHELAIRRLVDCEAEIAEQPERNTRKRLAELKRQLTLAQVKDELGQGNSQIEYVIKDEMNRIAQDEASERERRVAECRSRLLKSLTEAVLCVQLASEEALSESRMLVDRAVQNSRQECSKATQLTERDRVVDDVICRLDEHINQSFFDRLFTGCDRKTCPSNGTFDRYALFVAMSEGNTFVARIQEAARQAEVWSFNHLQKAFEIGRHTLVNLSCPHEQGGGRQFTESLAATAPVVCGIRQAATNEVPDAPTAKIGGADAHSAEASCNGIKQTDRRANTGEGRNGQP